MKKYMYNFYLCLFGTAFLACSKMNDLHGPFLNGERVYAAKPDSVWVAAGNHRVELGVLIKSQRIETIRVFWSDYTDSTEIHIGQQQGTFSVIIENLNEQSYLFNVVSLDQFGNKSLPYEISGNAHGEVAQSALIDRVISKHSFDVGNMIMRWIATADRILAAELKYLAFDLKCRKLILPDITALDAFCTEIQLPSSAARSDLTDNIT